MHVTTTASASLASLPTAEHAPARPPVNCMAEWHTRTGLLQLLQYERGGRVYLQHRDPEGSVVIELSPTLAIMLSGALFGLVEVGL